MKAMRTYFLAMLLCTLLSSHAFTTGVIPHGRHWSLQHADCRVIMYQSSFAAQHTTAFQYGQPQQRANQQPQQQEDSLYAVLGVHRYASPADIRQAYRSLAKELHPDANLFHDTTEQFQRLRHAYDVLTNYELKMKYDMFGERGLRMATFADPFAWTNGNNRDGGGGSSSNGGGGGGFVVDLSVLYGQKRREPQLPDNYD